MKRFAASLLAVTVMAACAESPTPLTPERRIAPSPTTFSAPVSTPIPGHYIVVFNNTVTNATSLSATMAAKHHSTVDHVYTSALKGMALALTAAEADAMRADPNVAYVEQDQTGTLSSTQTNAPWAIDRIDQRALPLNGSYTYNADGTGVTVYIIDTGINFTHVDFGGRASKGIDIVTPGGTAADCNGHGTGIASLVGGATFGVAKNVRLVAVRIGDCAANIAVSDGIAGVDWVTANRTLPAVVNMSASFPMSTALNQSVQNSIASGVLYAVAAGNASQDACTHSPQSAAGVLTVSSSGVSDQFSTFSNFGPCTHISAPGEGISMAWVGSDTATHGAGGTSYSAPHVAGIAALYIQANPTATAAQVRAAILANGTVNTLTSVPPNTPNLLAYSGFISAGNQAPVARFTVTCPTRQCTFNGSTSTDDVGIVSYAWTWGDGRSETHVGSTSNNTYAVAGTYSVTLKVTDGGGLTNSVTTPVQVPSTAPVNQPPVANFTFTCGSVGSRRCTVNGSTSTDDVAVVSYTWDWGNGRTETHIGPSSTNTWATAGAFNVTLTVRDGSGLTSTIAHIVNAP